MSAPAPGYLPILRANNITEDGPTFSDLVYVPASAVGIQQRLRANDVLVATSSGSIAVVGKAVRIAANFEGGFGAFCKVLRPSAEVDPAYFAHFFKTRAYRQRVSSLAAGANINNLRNEHLDDFEIPLPPRPEQRRIAEVLDRAETLRAQRRQALAQLDALAEGIFLALFEGRKGSQWPRVTIGEIATKLRTGPFGSQLLHSEFVESGVAVLGIDNVVQNEFVWAQPRYITASKFKQLERYRVAPGDVLVTIMGTCGRCAIVPEDMPVAINTKHLCCITLDQSRCLPSYLKAALLQHPEALHQLGVHERGAVMPGLNMQLIRDLAIPLPPLPIQVALRATLAAVSSQKRLFESSLAHLNTLFTSLQHRAFRGEL